MPRKLEPIRVKERLPDGSVRFRPSNRPNAWAFIDAQYEHLLARSWRVVHGYLMGWFDGQRRLLHSLIAELEGRDWSMCDHKNRNKLDCRSGNLREADARQNAINHHRFKSNTSGYTGVCLRPDGRYEAYIGHKYLGRFGTPQEASRVRDDAAKVLYGPFASLNGGANVTR